MRYLDMMPLGDQAIIVKLGEQAEQETYRRIRALAASLEHDPITGMIEAVPGLTTVTVYYDPIRIASVLVKSGDRKYPYDHMSHLLARRIDSLDERDTPPSRQVEIPVCYGGEYGPDLEDVAGRNGLSVDDVIGIHSSVVYTVYMLGFAPGFPYLGGMDLRIAAPRKASPRLRIPAGSVGIAGGQTGIYPLETPGGWNLIGRTPMALFMPDRDPPTMLRAGDLIRFCPISAEHYRELEARAWR